MLRRIIGAPVLMFLRQEAETIDYAIREMKGIPPWLNSHIPFRVTAMVMWFIMSWGVLGILTMIILLVLIPYWLGVDDAIISGYFLYAGCALMLPWPFWAMHWQVILFAYAFGHEAAAQSKQERAHARLAWWRGLGPK